MMMNSTGRSAIRTGAAIVAALAFAQTAQTAQASTTVTTAPAGYSTAQDWNPYTLGQVDLAAGTNQILGLTSSVDLVDQGWGGSDGTNGVIIQLYADGRSLWGQWVAGGQHSWTHQTFDIADYQTAFDDLNTAIGAIDWATTSNASMVMSHRGWGYPGWRLTTANATMTVTSDASAVPEPASWAMMMIGFGAMGYAMRRKAKVSANVRFA